MNLTGTWKGYYEYGVGYDLPAFGKRVRITADIKDEEEAVTGTIQEESSEFSVADQAVMDGFKQETLISFVKRYSKKPVLNALGELIVDETEALEIEHSGYIDQQNNALYGKWMMVERGTDAEGNSYEYLLEGIWFLQKVD